MSACDSCPSKAGCTSQSTCPSANGEAQRSSAPTVEPSNANTDIKKVIGVASGKGGVGKSFVTSALAVLLARKGYKVGIMDADVTGPSIPRAFGLKETFRMTYRPGDMNLYQAPRTAMVLKHKASVKYLGLGSVVPYAAFEVRNTLNDAAYSGTYVANATTNKDRYQNEQFLGYTHTYVNRLRAQLGVTVKFNKHHELDFYLLGDHLKDKTVDTNREGSNSWKENGLVLKSIDWHTGNMITAGLGYKWSF